ncbi:LysR family transcriptional regulator [Rhodoplanes roseus]|uniref:LysR family transcriptional regulator n=1 Tax=Rhodoplanes roseus TaxID=29409 RepID=A0A327L8N4_9BRAD|nr:LysR family transcriptional regulator [Rhodoplanes roseus]RAI45862.1 LysR family transcriptional regulator [Rhodoplanes roseus]
MPDPHKALAWDDFRLIKAIADAKTLPAAATLLDINHSTVFRRLGQIEAALGTPLFERHRAGYAATAAGEEMVALARRMDDDVASFTRRIVGQEVSPSGELRVTTNDSLLVHLLTPLFAKFRKACPDVRLDIVLSNQALNLSKRDADVAIRATDSPPETLVGRRAASIAWALYGCAGEFPDGPPADEAALFGRDWIALGEHLASLEAVKFVRARVPPERIAYRVNSVLGLAEAVESGLGIGHLPCLIGDARPALVRLAPPDPALAADLWLLTHPDLRHAPRVRVFLDFLAAELAKLRRFIAGEEPRAGA